MIDVRKFRTHRLKIFSVILFLLQLSFTCFSLNDEGLVLLRFRESLDSDPFESLADWRDDIGVLSPCAWFGVECLDGSVVALNLKNLCLVGKLAPELGKLIHMNSIILRNNFFYGIIPEEIGGMKELEVLDLGHNNFSGPLPYNIGNNLSLAIVLLDNNVLFGSMLPEFQDLKMHSEVKDEEHELLTDRKDLSCSQQSDLWIVAETRSISHRVLLQINNPNIPVVPPPLPSPSLPPSPSPSPSLTPFPSPSPSPSPAPAPAPAPDPSLAPKTNTTQTTLSIPLPSPARNRSKSYLALILSVSIGGPVLILVFVIGILFCRGNKMASVRPWGTGLSGQLRKALVTGVPKLKKSELEAACEDFSNVICSLPIGTVFKGILSNGVEIAVISVVASSANDWSDNLEAQFRNKIDRLSKINHKNFVNLIGYCQEDAPFTRMLVFEYAPNGTLFEHLHIKEAEHLDWAARMRITMGIAYCLNHMHSLTPPIPHENLNATSINLMEDYAAKISDFGFWNKSTAIINTETSPQSNVYSFGVIMFEMVTGRIPFSISNINSIEDWASDYLRGDNPLLETVDPILTSFKSEQVEQIGELIRICIRPESELRPTMEHIVARLRDITGITPDGAVPKLSPLWWAELEILSSEAIY